MELVLMPSTGDSGFPSIVTSSPVMDGVLAAAEALAKTDLPILIEGETGTGKDVANQGE